MKIEVLSLAQIEASDAFKWYEKNEIGLGVRFIESIEDSFNFIKKNPKACEENDIGIRVKVIKTFSYSIF